jgi:4-carboxymuconolactone decarboxylase
MTDPDPAATPSGFDPERLARGAEVFEDVYGGLMGAPAPGSMPFSDMMLAQLFAEHWDRPELDRRARRLLTLGILAASGDAGAWSIHLEAALRNGELTPTEARESVLHASQYAGYPKASPLLIATEEVIARTAAKADGSDDD